MIKIAEITDKRFYGKELNEQNTIILFKRPFNAQDSVFESYCHDILQIVKCSNGNLFVSDIVDNCKWNSDEKKVIEHSLYVRSANNEDPITADDILCERHGIYDIVLYKNKEIAKIIVKQKSSSLIKFIYLLVLLMFSLGLIKWCTDKCERNRISSNQDAYFSDIRALDSLSYLYDSSISSSSSYSPFIYEQSKLYIAHQIDSLREVANSNIEMACESGDYSSVIGDIKKCESTINQLIEEAKSAEQVALENARIERNRKTYEKDVQTIKSLEDALLNVTNNQTYSNYVSESQVQIIKAVLDSLNNTAEASFSTVAHSGVYNKLSIDSVGIWGQIQAIAESAQEESERKNKYKRTVVTPVRSQRNITPSSSTRSNDKTRYDNFVKLANQDYNNYYMTRDVTAARRAISNYSEALRINYNSNIAKRCDKLKKELGL